MIWRALNKRTKIKSKIPVSKICGWIDIGEAARIVVRIIVLVGTQEVHGKAVSCKRACLEVSQGGEFL